MWCHLKFREITRNKWDESLRFWTLELWTKEKRWLCLTPKHYIHYHIQFKFMLTIVNECKIVFGFVLSTRIYYWFTLIRCKTQTYFGKNRSERFLIEKKNYSLHSIFFYISRQTAIKPQTIWDFKVQRNKKAVRKTLILTKI